MVTTAPTITVTTTPITRTTIIVTTIVTGISAWFFSAAIAVAARGNRMLGLILPLRSANIRVRAKLNRGAIDDATATAKNLVVELALRRSQ